MNIQQLKGRPVVSMADGAKVASIATGLVDATNLRIVGFLLEGKPGKGFLPLASIRGFGEDAFTIDTSDVIKWTTGNLPQEDGRPGDEVIGLMVVDSTGTQVGTVHDFAFEPTDGSISTFDVRSGGVFGLGAHGHIVSRSSVRGIGKSLMTVESVAAESNAS